MQTDQTRMLKPTQISRANGTLTCSVNNVNFEDIGESTNFEEIDFSRSLATATQHTT